MRTVALLAVLLLAAGCGKRLPPPEEATAAPPAAHTGPPLTEDDYRAFGQELERAVAAGDAAVVNRLLRMRELAERSVADIRLSETNLKALRAGLTGFGDGGLGRKLADEVKGGGSYQPLRVRTTDGRTRLLMRLIVINGAVNYHSFALVRHPDGEVGAADVDVMTLGEPMSRTIRRTILTFLHEMDQGVVARLTESDRVYADNLPAIDRVMGAVREGRHKEVLAGVRQLPPELRREKLFQLAVIQAAQKIGNEADYLAELERFRRDHPGDPASDLLSIDYFLLNSQFDEALAALNRVNEQVGGDPYLAALKAYALFKAGRHAEAVQVADGAIADEPTLPAGYIVRARAAAAHRDYRAAREWFHRAVEKAGAVLNPDGLKADADFAGFVTSAEFGRLVGWWADRKKE